jgi:hypothetical protein
LPKSFSLFCLQLHNHSFAFFQRVGEFSFAPGDRVLAESVITPAMQGGGVPGLVGGKFLNAFRIGEQAIDPGMGLRRRTGFEARAPLSHY